MKEKEVACFISTKAGMLHELVKSKEKGNVLGIWSPYLGNGMFLCTVTEVRRDEDEEDIMIVFKEIGVSLPGMEIHVVYLHEIDRIYSFVLHTADKNFVTEVLGLNHQ